MSDLSPGSSPPRRSRRFSAYPGAPCWVWWIAAGCGLVVLAFFALFNFPVVRSTGASCARCGMYETRTRVVGLPIPRSPNPSPGSELFARVEGACTTHDWRSSTCTYSSNGIVACGRGDPRPPPIYELCARADVAYAHALVRRLARLSEHELEQTWDSTQGDEYRVPDAREKAREWVHRIVESRGWQDLEGR